MHLLLGHKAIYQQRRGYPSQRSRARERRMGRLVAELKPPRSFMAALKKQALSSSQKMVADLAFGFESHSVPFDRNERSQES